MWCKAKFTMKDKLTSGVAREFLLCDFSLSRGSFVWLTLYIKEQAHPPAYTNKNELKFQIQQADKIEDNNEKYHNS